MPHIDHCSTCLKMKLHQGLGTNTVTSRVPHVEILKVIASKTIMTELAEDVVQAPPDFRSNDCQVSSSESPRDKNRAHNQDLVPFSSIHRRLLLQVSKQKSISIFRPLSWGCR